MSPRAPYGHTLLRTGTRILEWNNRRAGEYAKARYGASWGPILVAFTEATIERLVLLEENVIDGGDEGLLAFKTSLTSELSMVAVAVCLGISCWDHARPLSAYSGRLGRHPCTNRNYLTLPS